MRKEIIRAIIFILILVIILLVLSKIFVPASKHSTIISEFYNEPKNTLDVIFVGHFLNNKRSERVIEKAGFQFLKNDVYQTAFGSIEQTKEYVKYNPKHTYLDYQRVK